MANPLDALAQLKDIHLPQAVGWWPLAPGWYMLLLLLILVMMTSIFWVNKKRKQSKPKKQALKLLSIYLDNFKQDHNASLASARISELLKRVALVYYPRQKVASMHGEAWINFLNQTSKGLDFFSVRKQLLELPFKENEPADIQPLVINAKQWIKQRRRPCSN